METGGCRRPSCSRCHPSNSAPAISEVQGDGTGNVVVTFTVPVLFSDVTPSEMQIDIDTGNDGTEFQVSPNQVGFTAGSSFAGAVWISTGAFAVGIPAGTGVLDAL